MRKLLATGLICFTMAWFGNHLKAQGVHFSYLEFAPQSINPAYLGGFLGSYRGTAIYRSQYNNGEQVRGYNTFEIGLDIPIIRGFRKQDWIGGGLSFNVDQRGFFSFKDTYSRLGLSYHFSLDKKQTSVLTLGIQIVNVGRSIRFPEGQNTGFQILNNTSSDPYITSLQTKFNEKGVLSPAAARDWVGGLAYTRSSKTNVFRAGFSVSGIFPARVGFDGLYELPFKFIGHAAVVNQINKTISVEPAAIYQKAGYTNEFMFNTKIGYTYNKEKTDKIKAGLGFRTGTFSAIFLVGGEIKGINFGLSYDLPISGYALAPGTQNGFEFGASYVGVLKKTPKPKPIIICPRL